MRVIDWLLEGDPAVRWQALRDLAGWNTLRALRVLEWWGHGHTDGSSN